MISSYFSCYNVTLPPSYLNPLWSCHIEKSCAKIVVFLGSSEYNCVRTKVLELRQHVHDIWVTRKLNLERGTGIEGVENAGPVRICRNLEKLDFPQKVYLIYAYDWEDKPADIWVKPNPRFLQKELLSQKLYVFDVHTKIWSLVQNRVLDLWRFFPSFLPALKCKWLWLFSCTSWDFYYNNGIPCNKCNL